MAIQLMIVSICIFGAVAYLLRQCLQASKSSIRGCSGGCSCGSPVAVSEVAKTESAFIPSGSLVLRRR